MSLYAPTRIFTTAEFRPHTTATTPRPGLADPATVTLKIKDPAGGTTTFTHPSPAITRLSVGVYEGSFTATAGTWSWQWITTGTDDLGSPVTEIVVRPGL